MKKRTVVLTVDLSSKANEQLTHIAHDRDTTVEEYLAECIHAKLHDMVNGVVSVSYDVPKEE